MSDGLKYLRKVIDEDDRSSLFQTSETDYLDSDIANELAVYEFLIEHSTEHHELPSIEAVRTETGVRLPEAQDSASYYLNKIIERKIYNAARDINQDFRSDMAAKDVSNLYSIGRRFMDIANDPRISNSSMYDHSGMANAVEASRRSMYISGNAIPTGMPSLDNAMMGGLRSSDFVFLIARTNEGKSQLLMNSAKTAYGAGNKILIISMEMVMDDMSMLFMSHMAGINPKYVNPYYLGTHEQMIMDRVVEQIRDEDRVYIHKGGSNMTPNKVRWLIESLAPDIVYTDSMYLMSPDGSNTSRMDRYAKVAEVTDQMLDIIVDCGVPIFNTSQFNRQAGKGASEGSLENIGFSDTISTHASLIISLKKVFIGNAPRGSNGVNSLEVDPLKREVEVLKSRKGSLAPFQINFMFSPMNFDECEPPVDEDDALLDEEEFIYALNQE